MGQTAFWGFEMVPSWNLMSVLMNDVTVSLKWLTVTLKIETAYRHGTNCFLGVRDNGQLESHVGLESDVTVSLKWLTVTLKIEMG